MKIFFADLDGPFANDRTALQTGMHKKFDPVSAEIMSHFGDAFGIKFVCLSNRFARVNEHYKQFRSLLEQAGFDPKHLHENWSVREPEDWLDDIAKNKPRHEIVTGWLIRNPKVTHFCVVDDEIVHMPNFVPVSQSNGISYENFEQIAKCLDVDLGKVFDAARRKQGFVDEQYDLPFGPQEETTNRMIDKSFSNSPNLC